MARKTTTPAPEPTPARTDRLADAQALAAAIRDRDPEAFARIRSQAALRDGEITLAEAFASAPMVTRKGRVVGRVGPAYVDDLGQVMISCWTWDDLAAYATPEDLPPYLALHGITEGTEAEVNAAWERGEAPKTAADHLRKARKAAGQTATGSKPREPRLPPVGTVLTFNWKGTPYTLVEREDGIFECHLEADGHRILFGEFKTPSGAAAKIASRPMNGFDHWKGMILPPKAARVRKSEDPAKVAGRALKKAVAATDAVEAAISLLVIAGDAVMLEALAESLRVAADAALVKAGEITAKGTPAPEPQPEPVADTAPEIPEPTAEEMAQAEAAEADAGAVAKPAKARKAPVPFPTQKPPVRTRKTPATKAAEIKAKIARKAK